MKPLTCSHLQSLTSSIMSLKETLILRPSAGMQFSIMHMYPYANSAIFCLSYCAGLLHSTHINEAGLCPLLFCGLPCIADRFAYPVVCEMAVGYRHHPSSRIYLKPYYVCKAIARPLTLFLFQKMLKPSTTTSVTFKPCYLQDWHLFYTGRSSVPY